MPWHERFVQGIEMSLVLNEHLPMFTEERVKNMQGQRFKLISYNGLNSIHDA